MGRRVSVKPFGATEKWVKDFLSTPQMRALLDPMEAAAETIVADARETWPVLRNTKGKPYRRKNSPREHSRDQFEIETRLLPKAVEVVVHQRSPHGYFIRSRLTGMTEAQQADFRKWDKGERTAHYEARVTSGTKRHAWRTLVLKPGRKQTKRLGKELQALLQKAANRAG